MTGQREPELPTRTAIGAFQEFLENMALDRPRYADKREVSGAGCDQLPTPLPSARLSHCFFELGQPASIIDDALKCTLGEYLSRDPKFNVAKLLNSD